MKEDIESKYVTDKMQNEKVKENKRLAMCVGGCLEAGKAKIFYVHEINLRDIEG